MPQLGHSQRPRGPHRQRLRLEQRRDHGLLLPRGFKRQRHRLRFRRRNGEDISPVRFRGAGPPYGRALRPDHRQRGLSRAPRGGRIQCGIQAHLHERRDSPCSTILQQGQRHLRCNGSHRPGRPVFPGLGWPPGNHARERSGNNGALRPGRAAPDYH